MIKIKLEKLVPIHLNILGIIFICIGIYNLLGLFFELIYILISLPFLIIGLFLATAKSGIIIDKINNKFKNCVFFLGLEIGKWKTLSPFSDIALLTKNRGVKAYSRGQRTTTFTNKFFEVYMLTNNHRERIILKRYKDEGKAKVFAQDIALQLNMKFAIFSPH
tara:strand:- start:119 stop:607 length:489 start_codon:yes stop_codon:yes gene_type:complete